MVWSFGRVGNWKYYGVTISSENWKVKTLSGNEFGENHTTPS
jgi:hypothetical protein